MSFKSTLLSTTMVSLLAGASLAVSAQAAPGEIEMTDAVSTASVLPDAQTDGGGSCNPCAAKACNPCNPCAAKACNPCNPCAAKACNPCNPCAAKACNPCNPCAAKACNPCNPCAAKAKNPCGSGSCNPEAQAAIGMLPSAMALPDRFRL